MKVLVCGGEDCDRGSVFGHLDALHRDSEISRIIHGCERGPASLAFEWAISNCVPVICYPADWVRHGKAAAFRRNARMLREERPDLVMAFPGDAEMVRLAMAVKIRVVEL